MIKKVATILIGMSVLASTNANAWFFFFLPIPLPTGMPPSFYNQIKTLEDSNRTKAFAYVGEDKTFGSKFYVSGWYLGDLNQKEAIKIALERCNANLGARSVSYMAFQKCQKLQLCQPLRKWK